MMIGMALRALREEQGWSQGELARRSEVSQGVLSRIEGGDVASPGIEVVIRLCGALDVSVDMLLYRAGRVVQRPLTRRAAQLQRMGQVYRALEAAFREARRAARHSRRALRRLQRAVEKLDELRIAPTGSGLDEMDDLETPP